MLWNETVIYQGNQYRVTNTYSDGTVDLDNGIEFIPDVSVKDLGGAAV